MGPTPADLFHKLVDQGMRRVLCEKSLSNSLEAAYGMCERAEEESVRLLVHHGLRYPEGFEPIREGQDEYGLNDSAHFVARPARSDWSTPASTTLLWS